MNFLIISTVGLLFGCFQDGVTCLDTSILPSSSSIILTNVTSSIHFAATPNTLITGSTEVVQTNLSSTVFLSPVASINGTELIPSPATASPLNSSRIPSKHDIHTTPDGAKCFGYTNWNPDVFLRSLECLTEACVQSYGVVYNHYIQCNSRKRKEETQVIAVKLSEILIYRAEMITEETANNRSKTVEKISEEHLAAEFGTLKRQFYISHKFINIDFTDHAHGIIKDEVHIPPTILEEDAVSFHCSIYTDIYNPTDNFLYWREITPLRQALGKLPPSLTNPAPEEDIGYQINSNILFFVLSPIKKYYKDYITLKFYYRDPTGTTNHRCVRFTSFWTDAGCYVHQLEADHVICRCDTIVGRYAIISDLAITPATPPKLERDSISLALMAISGFGVFAALASMLLPYLLGCQHLRGMLRVYKAADITFIVYCGFIFLSVLKSDDMNTAKLLAAVLHFFHHASALWFIVEGVHLYHEMTPLYSDSIGMIFCYSTLAFGISAALAGAATGYDFQFSGRTQFLWAFGQGGSIMYMFVPTIGTIIMQIAFDILLVWELMSWIGSQYDYLYTRSIVFIRRSTCYTFVYAVTHVFGVIAMNQGTSTYARLFIGFYGIETICLFYHHCISNMECWSWKELQDFKKEMERDKELGLDDDDDDEEASDMESDVENDKKSEEKEGKGDLVINMENGSVFYGKPSIRSLPEPPVSRNSSDTSSRLTRRKSKSSMSSRVELIREDSSSSDQASNHSDSQRSVRKSPMLSPRLNDEAFQAREEDENEEEGKREGGDKGRSENERPISRASIATTVSQKSLRDEAMDETSFNENEDAQKEAENQQNEQFDEGNEEDTKTEENQPLNEQQI